MKIFDYYRDYNTNKNYKVEMNPAQDKTIKEFFEHCISRHLLPMDNVLAWHKMFMEYVERPDAILWVRYYEGGNKDSGRWNTRRACMTRFKDGFTYVFVSNYDAHEIFNMTRMIANPDINEFAKMMNEHTFPLHFDKGGTCEESDMASFPNIGNVRGGILTPGHWYLAHIYGLKNMAFLRANGSYEYISRAETNRIYPRGNISDWKRSDRTGLYVRELDYSLSSEEKNLVKAHFLRFVDPLNYYVTPVPNYEKNDVKNTISSYEPLNEFVASKYEEIYGAESMEEFRDEALVMDSIERPSGDKIINISYGTKNKKTAIAGTDEDNETIESAVSIERNINANNNYAKALNRIPRWAKRSHQINHKILRSYFKAVKTDGTATLQRMKEFASELRTFDQNFISMTTDKGNSHGKVFEYDSNTDKVFLWPVVEDVVMQHRAMFE